MENEIKQCLNKLFKANKQVENLQSNIVGIDMSLLLADITPNDIVFHIKALIEHLKNINGNIQYSYIISKVTENWEYAWDYYIKLFISSDKGVVRQDIIENYLMETDLITDYNIDVMLDKSSVSDCILQHIKQFDYTEYENFDEDFEFIKINM